VEITVMDLTTTVGNAAHGDGTNGDSGENKDG